MSPGVLCNYVFELAKIFSLFYHDHPIMKEINPDQKAFRIVTCKLTSQVIKSGFSLLGIQVPDKM
jgi:arginyl-tRNA synthetase